MTRDSVTPPSRANHSQPYGLLTLDAHLDTPVHFSRAGWSFADRHDLATDLSQVDMPRMRNGGLSGGFFVIFTKQGPMTAEGYAAAQESAQRRSNEIDGTITRFPDEIQPAVSADDARRIHASGKLIAFKSIENCYPLGENLNLLGEFYNQGVRMAGPVHALNNQFADSSTDTPHWDGLSPLGQRWVDEMNRLGLVIDASHASDAAFDQMLAQSTTPIVLSHSGTRSAYDCPRNIDDERIRQLAAAGGVICFTTIYLSPMRLGPERAALFGELGRIGELSSTDQSKLTRRWRALDEQEPMWDADFGDFMTGLLHTLQVAGPEHVCFGADWDGGGGIRGLQDVGGLPRIHTALTAAGYSNQELANILGGNLLRILEQARSSRRAEQCRPVAQG